MLRDTFAVELLNAGMLLENVSKLLTHKSVRVTEQHYATRIKTQMVRLTSKARVKYNERPNRRNALRVTPGSQCFHPQGYWCHNLLAA